MFIQPEIEKILKDMGLKTPQDETIRVLYRHSDTMLGYIPDKKYPYIVSELEKHYDGVISAGGIKRLYEKPFSDFACVGWEEMRKKYGVWARSGKVFKNLYPDISDKIVENFVARFNIKPATFELWADITKAYACDSRSGVHSCMTSDNFEGEKRWGMDFYEKNGVKILVMLEEDRVIGRALVWEGIEFKHIGKQTMMDRVYAKDSKDFQRFKEYAEKHNWVFREGRDRFTFNGKTVSDEKATYQMINTDIVFWPYADTLTYADYTEKRTILNNFGKGVGINSGFKCPLPIKIYSNYERQTILQSQAIMSEVGWILEENSVKIGKKVYPRDMTFPCDSCGEEHLKEDNPPSEMGKYYCKKCGVETVSGHIELKKDCLQTYNSKWVLKGKAIHLRNGKISYEQDPNIIKDDFCMAERLVCRISDSAELADKDTQKTYTTHSGEFVMEKQYNYWVDTDTGYLWK